MKRTRTILPAMLLLGVLVVGGRALAESGTYSLLRGVAGSSGVGAAQSGPYQLQTTLGEPVVGQSASGITQIRAGFWYSQPGTGAASGRVFVPMLTR